MAAVTVVVCTDGTTHHLRGEYKSVRDRLLRDGFGEFTTLAGRKALINPVSVARVEEPPADLLGPDE
jgi:hypothetical protein